MGLRSLLVIFVVQALLWHGSSAKSIRKRRNTSITVDNNPSKRDVVMYSASSPTEAKAYHPPLLAAPPAATVARSVNHNAYQPPLLLAQSNDYKPLISSSQTQSVRYQAPANSAQPQGVPLAYAQSQSASQGYSAPLLASAQTGNLNTLPLQQGSRQGFAYSGDHGSANQFNHQPAVQAESQPEAAAVPSTGDGKNDEYVVYYYYYYDNDTSANSSSNFDDIPSLESYDTDKSAKEPEKSASARTLAADVNSLSMNEHKRLQDSGVSAQPRSASSGNSNQPPFIRSDKPAASLDDLGIQPLKPVSNVFRYGSNEVPRFPILPNFVVSEAPPPTKAGNILTSEALPDVIPTTQAPSNAGGTFPGVQIVPNPDQENDDSNNVVDQPSNSKAEEEKVVEEPTTTTTTEPPTTTELPTTTTERSRRRPGTGSRRRFNPSPASFSSNRRQPPSRSTSTTSTSTTTVAPGPSSTRGSFRGSNRVRPRPTVASNRPRPSFSRNAPSTNENEETRSTVSAVSTSSTTARPRFGASPSTSRRFSSTRTRSQPTGTTKSTTTTTTAAPRARPAPRPRPNIIPNRSRPPRPGLFRSRTPSEPEEPETTTTTPETVTEEESSPASPNEASSPEENETVDDSDEEEDTSDTETEEPTTTEKSRFSALFRPRNRSTLNRPRPQIGRRSR